MNEKRILWLVKFFQEEEHAEQFLRGCLYLNRLSYFKGIEGEDGARGDPNEAVWAWFQPAGLKINLNLPGVGDVEITEADLAEPVSFSYAEHDHAHLYCMYAIHISGVDFNEDGTFELDTERADDVWRQLSIDDRCRQFGRYAVVVRAVEFLDRLRRVLLQRRQWFRARLVTYYDDETFNGEIPLPDILFHKQKRFDYQQEFRICVRTGTEGEDPLWIEMGDLSDIAGKTEADLVGGLFQLNLQPAAHAETSPPSVSPPSASDQDPP